MIKLSPDSLSKDPSMASQSPDQESAPQRPNLSVFILEAPPNSNSTNNDDGGGDGVRSEEYDRIVFIDPITQSMIVLQGANVGSLFSSSPKEGHRPASKAAVAAMKRVEEGSGECAICLDEWEGKDTVVKEMPCKHRFHGECIEKWLRIHGNCPVCRYAMPVDEEEESGRMNGGGGGNTIFVSFGFIDARRRQGREGDDDGDDDSS